jgi:hypothetical protein
MPHAYREDDGRKDLGWGLLNGACTSPLPDADDPTVTDAVAPATNGGRGTSRALGK